MSHDQIKEALNDIINEKYDSMRNRLSAVLSEKAIARLDEKKQEIAKSYFGKE